MNTTEVAASVIPDDLSTPTAGTAAASAKGGNAQIATIDVESRVRLALTASSDLPCAPEQPALGMPSNALLLDVQKAARPWRRRGSLYHAGAVRSREHAMR